MNLNKIGILFTAIDPDVLISDFAKVKEGSGNYYGTKGSIRLENSQIHLYYKMTNDEIKFSANMFLNYGNNFAVSTQDRDGLSYATRVQDYKDGYPCYDDRGYPYYNSNAIGKYFVNPSLFVFDGSTFGIGGNLLHVRTVVAEILIFCFGYASPSVHVLRYQTMYHHIRKTTDR